MNLNISHSADFSPDVLKRNYKQIMKMCEMADVNLQWEVYQRLLDRNNPDFVMAEVGCGNGNAIEQGTRSVKMTAAGMGGKMVRGIGVDINPLSKIDEDILEMGGFHGLQAEFRKGDARDLPIRNNEVDILFSSNTLYIVSNALRALEDAYRVLKPGGKAVFHVLKEEISQVPGLDAILDSTPNARQIFKYVEKKVDGDRFGFIIVDKDPNVQFEGFQYEIDENPEVEPLNRIIAGRIYKAVGNDVFKKENLI